VQEFKTTVAPAREITYPEGFVSYHADEMAARAKLKRIGRGHEIKPTGFAWPPLMVVQKAAK